MDGGPGAGAAVTGAAGLGWREAEQWQPERWRPRPHPYSPAHYTSGHYRSYKDSSGDQGKQPPRLALHSLKSFDALGQSDDILWP